MMTMVVIMTVYFGSETKEMPGERGREQEVITEIRLTSDNTPVILYYVLFTLYLYTIVYLYYTNTI